MKHLEMIHKMRNSENYNLEMENGNEILCLHLITCIKTETILLKSQRVCWERCERNAAMKTS